MWNKIIEKSVIDINSNDLIRINTSTSLTKHTAKTKYFPKDFDYELENTTSINRSYMWSDVHQTFLVEDYTD